MHPLTAGQGRLSLYLMAWSPLALLLAYLLVMMGGLAWQEAVTLSFPLALFYSFICLAPWYMCRVLALGGSPALKILGNHLAAAIVAGLTWIVLAKGLGLLLGRYLFARLNQRFSPQLPLLFGIVVLANAVRVTLAPTPAQTSLLFKAIPARQCTRGDYDGKPLSNEELDLLERAGTSNGVRMLLLTERPAMEPRSASHQ